MIGQTTAPPEPSGSKVKIFMYTTVKYKKMLLGLFFISLWFLSMAQPAMAYTRTGTKKAYVFEVNGSFSYYATPKVTYDRFMGQFLVIGYDVDIEEIFASKHYLSGTKYFDGDWIKARVLVKDRITGYLFQDTGYVTVWDGSEKWNYNDYYNLHVSISHLSKNGFKIESWIETQYEGHGGHNVHLIAKISTISLG